MSTSMAQYMCEHYGWDDGWVDDPGFYANDDDDSQAYSSAEEECPRCNTGKLKLREGRYGKFWGCSNFPKCKYTKDYIENH